MAAALPLSQNDQKVGNDSNHSVYLSLTFHRKNVILLHTNMRSEADLDSLISCLKSLGFGTMKERKETLNLKGESFSRIGFQNDKK
jgi:hypothetical protein